MCLVAIKILLRWYNTSIMLSIDMQFMLDEEQDAQLSQRDRAAGYISFGRKLKTGTGRQYFTDIIGLSSTTVT